MFLSMRIALLEDDAGQAELLTSWITESGHTCIHYPESHAFIRALKRESFDLFILDWILPVLSGDEVLQWIKDNLLEHPPIMFVTGKNSDSEIAKILHAGADDYMVKPVRRQELLARIEALSRRGTIQSSSIIDAPPYKLDDSIRQLTLNNEAVKLSKIEYELTRLLFKNVGRLLSRAHILEVVWGHTAEIDTRSVDTHLSRLRKKLLFGSETGWQLNSVHGHGYRLENKADS
jgi:two-component system, OmpR family, response regulator RegX3